MSVTRPEVERPAGLSRFEFTAMISMLMASAALSIDLMLPAFGRIRADFGLPEDSTQVGAIITSFFLGFALAQILYGPLADRFGRKPTLYLGLAVYVLGAVGAALSPTLGLMIVSRFVWGVGAAAPRVVSLSVVRDLYVGDQMARAMSFIMAVFILVPVLAPSIGALILGFAPWRMLFVVVALFGVAVALWTLRLPETLDPAQRTPLTFSAVGGAARIVVTNRVTIGYTLAGVFAFGAFLSYLATSELIVSQVFDRESIFPLVFGATAAVMGAAMLANAWLVGWFGVASLARASLVVFVGLSAGLAALAVATGGVPSFGVFVVGLAVTLGAFALLFPNLNTLAMEPMGAVAGMAAAVIGTVSTTGGAIFGFLLDQTFDGTVLPLMLGFVGYGSVALVLAMWAGRGPSHSVST